MSSIILGCGRQDKHRGAVVATINKEPLYTNDLKKDLALQVKSDPLFKITPQTMESLLDRLIDKTLLIQEAKRQRLDQTDRFVSTIKTFWEQTLIRDLMIEKDKEYEEAITITDEETKALYEQLKARGEAPDRDFAEMKDKLHEMVKNRKKRDLFAAWLKEIRTKTDIKINNEGFKKVGYDYEQ